MSPETVVVQSIPLSQVQLNPANPRGSINPDTVDTLAANMATEGQKTSIKVTPLGMGQYQVVGGDHRVMAAKKLGWESIRAEVLDSIPDPDEAFLEAYLDNRGQPMGWWADYKAIEVASRRPGKLTQQQIADKTMTSRIRVNQALTLLPLLNTASREAICRNSTNQDQKQVSEDAVFNLRALGTNQPDGQERLQAALQVVIDRQMTAAQVKSLVTWVQAGNPADSFNPAKAKAAPKPVRPPKAEGAQEHHPAAHSAKVAPVGGQAANGDHHRPLAQPSPATHLVGDPQAANGDHHEPLAQPSPAAHLVGDQQAMGSAETALYEALAGISVIAKIKAKIKKGERPSVGERFLLVGYDLWHGLMWLLKNGLKLAKLAAKWIKYLFKSAEDFIIGIFEFFGFVKDEKKARLVILVIVLGFSWWYVSRHDVGHTVHMVYSKLFPAKVEATPSIPVTVAPTPQTAAKPSHKHKSVASVPTATPQTTAVVAQVTPTVAPKKSGDLVTQAAGAAPAVLQATDGVKKLFGF